MNRAVVILAGLLLAGPAVADPVLVSMLLESPENSSLPPAVFGGADRKFDLVITNITMPGATIHADLLAYAGKLSMPLGKSVSLSGTNLPGRIQFSLALPEVKRETDMLVHLSAKDFAHAAPVILGNLPLVVYPRDLAKQMASLLPNLPNGDKRLVVFGGVQELRRALQALHLPFEDAGPDLPGRFVPERIYLGDVKNREAEDNAHDRSEGAKLAVFADDDSLPPGIYMERDPGAGVYLLITLGFVDSLTDNPRSQLAFLKVLQSLTSN
jgi:hypothetical protein